MESRSFSQQWRLPGWTTAYRVVHSRDASDVELRRRVPEVFIIASLDEWLSTDAAGTLHDLYHSLGGPSSPGSSVLERDRRVERIKERIANAFLTGEVIAFEEARPAPGLAQPQAKPKPRAPEPAAKPDPERSFVIVRLVDDEGNPVPGQRYRVTLPDGSYREGTLNDKGEAREDHVVAGQCKIAFPDLEPSAWK